MTRSSLKLLNWPFRLKLLVAPGLALAAMALLAVLGASRLSEQSAAVSRVANAQAQTGALAAASQGIQDINGRIYKLLAQQAAHTEGLNAAAALRALNPQIDAVGQTLASYRDSYATPQTLPVVNALIADVQKYKGAVGVVSQMLDVDFGAAVSFLAPFDANFESLNRRLKSLADGVAQSAAIEARHSAQAAADSRSFFLALTAGVLLAVGAIGLMISEPTIASIKTIATTTMALAEGNSFIDLASLARNDELGSIVRSLAIFAQNQRRIASLQSEAAALQQSALAEQQAALEVRAQTERQQLLVVGALAKGLSSLASGDLGARLQTHFNPEYEQLRTDFNSAAGSLEEALGTIAEAAETVQQNAEEIARASEDLARRTEHQAANLQQTATALDQITGAVGKSASGAAEVAALVTTTRADADAAGQVVREAMGAMQAIEGSSSQIGQIIGMIDEIAFQTNLLALNAGVEAARAGDAGRGFAVVAQEVRALAQRATGAAREIKTLISTSSREVGSGVALVGRTGQGLQRIVDQVAAIDRLVQGISAASGDQARGLTEVNGATGHMDQAVQQNAAMVEQVSASAHVLNGEVGKLRALLGTFKVSVPKMSAPDFSAPAISAPGTPSRAARTRAAAFV